MTEWQPIETAPKDGRDALIAYSDGYIAIGWWSDENQQWCWQNLYLSVMNPTHWMPLPEPPTTI